MLSFKERLNLLESDLASSPPAFTMSADLPFAIFRYDPKSENEWGVRRDVRLLARRVETQLGKRVHILSLAKLYWEAIERSESIEDIIMLEQERGFFDAEMQVSMYLSDSDWCPLPDLFLEKIIDNNWQADKDLVFLLRTGVFAPSSYRISSLLEQLMGKVHVPVVMFYPGTWRESLNYLGLRKTDEPLASYRVKIYGRDS